MIAIIIYGPPGSGKGTQARLLAENLDLIHFDTGQHLEKLLYDFRFKKNKEIQRERHNFETGKLLTPSWVLKIIKKVAEEIAEAGWGIIFSGSPRTLYEAVGDQKHLGLMNVLEKNYGKKNIIILKLNILDEESIKRNSSRLICSVCKIQLLATFKKIAELEMCPFCGGKLYRRTLDKPEIIKIRLKEYRERTLPIEKELKKQGYKIININGESLPFKIHQRILSHLK
ncbi:MAG: nucleoside monophosphate kinase [Patescibacteria group bacterium]